MKTRCLGLIGAIAMSFFAACLAPSAAHAREADLELKLMKGTWKVIEFRKNGQKMSKEEFAGMKIVIDGNKMTLHVPGGKTEETTITLDSSKSPKLMDIHAGTDTVLAVYSLYDNFMTICLDKSPNAARPSEIPNGDTGAGKNLTVIVLELEK